MGAINCPMCGAYAQVEIVWSGERLDVPPRPPRYEPIQIVPLPARDAALRCMNCGSVVGGTVETDSLAIRAYWPESAITPQSFPDVPEHIAQAASEAHHCHARQLHRAAVLLARSVVEATAKERGITQGRLVDKIETMWKSGDIREHIKDGAHEVRYLGNEMAHGDFVDPVTPEESELVLTLMDEVLEEVFQSRARVARAKASRAAKAAAASNT